MAGELLYLEDLSVGQRFESGSIVVDKASILRFASEFDPQVFHTDEEAAKNTFFGGLAASGWHTSAMTMRLLVDGGLPLANGIIGAKVDVEWRAPVRPDDVLRVDSEILEVTPSKSRTDRGAVVARGDTKNQRSETVQVTTVRLVVFRRPAADTPAD